MKRIVIFGAGGHAHVVADVIRAAGDKVVAFLDDNLEQEDCSGKLEDYNKYKNCEFVIGIGDSEIREKISKINVKWHTAIHPSAIISKSVLIGDGTVVMPNVVINARSLIGRHCIINTSSVIEHDNNIGDFCHISVGANLGGNISLGEKTWVGIGSTIKNGINICSNVMIGAGSLIVKDISDSGVYFGAPATKYK